MSLLENINVQEEFMLDKSVGTTDDQPMGVSQGQLYKFVANFDVQYNFP